MLEATSPLSMVDGATPCSVALEAPSFFFLQDGMPLQRIFHDPSKGSTAVVAPSGVFPGGGFGTLADGSCRNVTFS
jgi:hypothetical protein